MKQLPDCLFEAECGTTYLFEIGRIFLEPNMQIEVPLGLYAKTFPPETIGLELIFFPHHAPQPRSEASDVMMRSGLFIRIGVLL